MEPSFDVLVVGAGCAGMRAAIEAHDRGAKVAVISKLHPTRSHSGAAEGGINAALGNKAEDSPEKHAFDTVKGSDYLGDQDAIEIFTAEAPGDIYQLEHWGCVFSRNDEGRLDQRPFGGARVAPRWMQLGDDSDARSGVEGLDRSTHPGAAGPNDDHVVHGKDAT